MTRKEFLAGLEGILNIDAGSLREDEELSRLRAWDSLSAMAVIAFIDERFGIVLNPIDLSKALKVSDLVALVDSKLSD